MSGEACERVDWRDRDTHVAAVGVALAHVHAEHGRHEHRHASARALNLVVAPDPARAPEVDERLEALGDHSPSRTVVLRQHADDRLEAQIVVDCQVRPQGVGFCHDRIVLTGDARRLAHADALAAPLMMVGVPTVVWLPGAQTSPAESALVELGDVVVLDSGGGDDARLGLARASRVDQIAVVHDLAWLRLAWWRARIAAAFEPPDRRALVPALDAVEIRHGAGAEGAGLLLAGWTAARLGWPMDARVTVAADPGAGAWGGVSRVELRAGEERVTLTRGSASERSRDAFAEALGGVDGAARGYDAALAAIAA